MSVQVSINDEPNGRVISLLLTREQYERAQGDTEYVQQLLRNFDAEQNTTHNIVAESEVRNEETEGQGNQDESRLFIWREECILLLLSLYEEHREEFNRKRHKSVYDMISQKMQETNNSFVVNGSQCQSKINSLKKYYKKIIDHNSTSGNDRASWPYFDRMNELFGSSGWANPEALASEMGPSSSMLDTSTNDTQTEPKKRKLECIIDEFCKDLRKSKEERVRVRQENFNKFLEMKERQHREKMRILQALSSNDSNGML